MLFDARKQAQAATLEADVCVIGAGAAGIAIALELAGTDLRVCLLESGGLDPDPATQELYRGRNLGRDYAPLDATRRRFFGGSTNCWNGLCRPLEPIDFEPRDWLPESGWPFGRETLDPYYARAQRVLGLGPFAYAADDWTDAAHPAFDLGAGGFETACLQIEATRFNARYRDDVAAAANVACHLHANAVALELRPGEPRVERVRVACLDGNRFAVRARCVVLATGGIENARLLLVSNDVQASGLGNAHDVVGRYFMEHPHVDEALLLPSRGARADLYRARAEGEVEVVGYLRPAAGVRRRERLGSTTTWLAERVTLDPWSRALRASASEIDAGGTRPASEPAEGGEPIAFVLRTESEQVPNPASRVLLSTERDALGTNRVRLDWRLTPFDRRTARRTLERLAQAVGRCGVGRLRLAPAGDDWPESLFGGNHHMGTTRMHVDPRRGVVDADGRVHGVANLFVAGSSVFPTGGAANPTLTLVALALRLADHLKVWLGA